MINFLPYFAPVAALALSEFDGTASKLAVYGPMGVICLWLMYREEKMRTETAKVQASTREDNAALREEISRVAHQMKGLNRNLLYQASMHGTSGVRDLAARELEQLLAKDSNHL